MFSSLTSGTVKHHNKYSSRQGQAVVGIILHHWAGIAGGDARLMSPKAKVSANYILYSTGVLKGQVSESLRAWTSGSFEADGSRITVEIQNTTGRASGKGDNDPNSWKISDKAMDKLIRLIADVAARYKWGTVTEGRVKLHKDFAATACPGGYVVSKYKEIVRKANDLLQKQLGNKESSAAKGSASTPTAKSVWVLADEVLAGVHGTGDARKKSLGDMYDAVQKEVNRRLGLTSTGSKSTAKNKTIAQLADEVLAGTHGTGDARKKSLGSRYDEVQKEVNRRLGIG